MLDQVTGWYLHNKQLYGNNNHSNRQSRSVFIKPCQSDLSFATENCREKLASPYSLLRIVVPTAEMNAAGHVHGATYWEATSTAFWAILPTHILRYYQPDDKLRINDEERPRKRCSEQLLICLMFPLRSTTARIMLGHAQAT
jgi:hypothetical protein